MKIISQAEQKKTILQIENLQKKVADLEAQLVAAKAEHKKLDAATVNSQAEAIQAQEALVKAKAEIFKTQSESSKIITDVAKLKKEALAASEATKSELNAARKELTALSQENELLHSQIIKAQSETAKASADIAKAQSKAAAQIEAQQKVVSQLESNVSRLSTELTAASAELVAAHQELTIARETITYEQHFKHAAEVALAELKARTSLELKAAKDEYHQQAQAIEQELFNRLSELAQIHQTLDIAQTEADVMRQAKLELDDRHARTLLELEQIKIDAVHQAGQHADKLNEKVQENELLLTQLMQVQEELESYYLGKIKFEKLYQDIQARWVRLEKRYPNYIDFGSVELVAFDNLSDVPSVTWLVKDCAQRGVAFDEFLFQIVLFDGQPGIALVTDAKATATENSALVPKLLKPQSKQLERFVRMGQTEFRQLMAATTIVTQLDALGWRGIALPKDFDLGFWRESLKLLPTQFQSLPVLFRYDAVKLKRELVNPDYEHLWLEFKGMGLGARTWPKFELRLGAAMVQRGGFSQFPKFEIPLIDGKTKPFDSWFAESHDDNGAKLELRFSLEKQVFDNNVWSKLEDADKALMLRLIFAMPDVLLRLEAEHLSIHRPWATWIGFARAAMLVIEKSRAAAKQMKVLPAPERKAEVNAMVTVAELAKLPATAPVTATPSAAEKKLGPKKPPAKAKPANKKVANKPVTVKKTARPEKSVAVKKAAPAKKSVAIQKALSVKKATEAKTVAAKMLAATKALAKKKPVPKK
jgi:predicted  nucleic acid-binding Zn-ribbon protein